MREPKATIWDGSPRRYAHGKRDGMWLTLVCDEHGHSSAWSRLPRCVTSMVDWHPAYQVFADAARPGTVMFCELFAADPVTGDALPRETVRGDCKQRAPTIQIECFAADAVAGEQVSAGLALDALQRLAEQHGLPFAKWVAIDGVLVRAPATLPGHEGWVMKDGNLTNWAKVKPTVTYDLICTGFVPGRGKFAGMIGAIVLRDVTGTFETQCSGMDDAERAQMTASPDSYVGRVFEIAAQGHAARGGLMHPRWVGPRPDKSPEQADDLSRHASHQYTPN